ncbi:nuclear transport factor 2 family protein [Agromyces sp. SYSU T00266]|uniref:nuclear transport factor 2 family protein n=1 Tax=Agromyces zhanjiangensis TaxID=3158562 RepID=UPI0033949B5D
MMSDPRAEKPAIAAHCRDTLIAFAHRLDHRRFEEASELFAEDGVWHRHGETLLGRERILEVISERPSSLIERHLFTTRDVEVESDRSARAISYAMIVRASGDRKAMVPTPGPELLAEFHDQLVLTRTGWRISRRSAVGVFRFGGDA